MRVGVLSDTHGNWDWAEEAVRRMGAIKLLLHAGDYYRDAVHLGGVFHLPVFGVMGNCDHTLPGPPEQVFTIRGVRLLLTHGHRYGVKRGIATLQARAREAGVRLVVYGHTHRQQNEEVEGIRFLNPGCTGSYAIIEFTERGFTAHIYNE